jgi:hypothetical protein
MRAILGLLLIMLGLAMAVVWMPEHDGERQLSALTEITTQGLPRHTGGPASPMRQDPVRQDDAQARTFSPKAPLISADNAPAPVVSGRARATPTVTIYDQGAETARAAPSGGQGSGGVAGAVVTGAIVAAVPLASNASVATAVALRPQPATTMSREELVRGLQRELRRVGCYWGEVDGSWGAGSKRAMGSFMDRVNASLPMEQPDFILLTLLQSHAGQACGKDCPAGQSLVESGRCMPNAVVAKAGRTTERRLVARETSSGAEIAQSHAQAQLQGQERSQEPLQVTQQTTQWATVIQRETAQTAAMASLAAGGAVAGVIAAPPGRMAVGGPATGTGAYLGPPPAPAQATGAVRAAGEAERPVASARRGARRVASERRLASRPLAPMTAPPYAYRYYYAPPAHAIRAPRPVAAPRTYATVARRAASRNWTATFFNQQ